MRRAPHKKGWSPGGAVASVASMLRRYVSNALAALALLLGSAELLRAELKFAEQRIEQTVARTAEEASAQFTFKNTGAKPVSIVVVTTSCRCLSASTPKQTYAPGEEGRLEARMVLTASGESEEKSIYVLTDAAPDQGITLVMAVRRNGGK